MDPDKKPADVLQSFRRQCELLETAIQELKLENSSTTTILTGDCLALKTKLPKVDLVVTSPPYVTSYEYADLHQLSSLWLGFASDFKQLRTGSIGSVYHEYNFAREAKRLNKSATDIVFQLIDRDKRRAYSVAKYFLDMQKVAVRVFDILESGGQAFFVIGNTEYKDTKIENARHLTEALYDAGFSSVSATKRKISKKFLTPYRTKDGKFSSNSGGRKIYNDEFIIVGTK